MTLHKFTADFETTTDPADCRVWAWAISEVGNSDNIEIGNTMESFIEWCASPKMNPKLYFHNLKFDGEFIISYLLSHGFSCIEKKEDAEESTFETLISDMGQFYSITIYFSVKKWEDKKGAKHTKYNKVTIYDSLKILNMSVDAVAKGFGLPIGKLKIDYRAYREPDHVLTDEESEYIKHDVKIMSLALEKMFEQGLTAMTIGSDALTDYKNRRPDFKRLFPVLPDDIDAEIRHSYKGGFTYLNPKYQEQETGAGVVFDKNSMYPSKMKQCLLPYGVPQSYGGRYQYNASYPLYIQRLCCRFEIKPNRIPSLQIKNHTSFMPNKYLLSSDGEFVNLTLTSVDLDLFLKQYDVDVVSWDGGFMFSGAYHLFDDYVDNWTKSKIQSKKDGNKALYLTSKLLLNSLYGKFGLNPHCAKKIPYLEDGVVHYRIGEDETRDSIYCAEASFITSYAREDIILSSQAITDWSLEKYGEDLYVYSDTDSIHMLVKNHDEDVEDMKGFLDIDDYRLGAWKLESEFKRGKYLRQKCYIEEDYDGNLNTTIAGLPKKLGHVINFDNFKVGFTTADLTDEEIGESGRKLSYVHTKGGVILSDVDFTIK